MARPKDKSVAQAPDGRKDKADDKPKTPTQELWELGLCLGIAVLLALVIKYLLIEVFVIPSGSMEPTLHGRPDGGDRVLCTKVNYKWRPPRRWEIFVFEYPADQAETYSPYGDHSKYRDQNFIKRCVGLPGDRLAIARGDIYTQKTDGTWERQVKPHAVQESLWIPVYEESFDDLDADEFQAFWEASGRTGADTFTVTPDDALRIRAGEPVHLTYRPRLPTGVRGEPPRTLPGIPDRYVLRQPVTFVCPACEGRFRKTVWNQKIAGRCPHCSAYLLEDAVTRYGRRSGLPTKGAYSQAGLQAKQGEDKERDISYHWVADLRVKLRVRFPEQSAANLAVELRDEDQQLQLVLSALNGTAALRRNNGDPFPIEHVGLADGAWHTLAFCQADGVARVFVDEADTPLLTARLPVQEDGRTPDGKPPGWETVSSSGVRVAVAGGIAEIDDLHIDRDIHYYWGREADIARSASHDYPEALIKNGVFNKRVFGKGYIALGDNCPSSNDSRCWGPVPAKNLRGPAILVWWPPHRIHPLPVPGN